MSIPAEIQTIYSFEVPCKKEDCLLNKGDVCSYYFEKVMGYKCYWTSGGRFDYDYKFHNRLLEDFPEAFLKVYSNLEGDIIRGETLLLKEVGKSFDTGSHKHFALFLNKQHYLRYVKWSESRAIKKAKKYIRLLEDYIKDHEEWDGEDLDNIPMMKSRIICSIDYLTT